MELPGLNVDGVSDEASVTIGQGCSANGARFVAASGASIIIGDNCILGALVVHACAGAAVRIGSGVGFNGSVRLLLHEPRTITIGDDCLFAGGVDVTVSDMHSIVLVKTGRRLNPPADITIGNRVWIGQRSMVLKGASLGDGSIVGASAVVTKTYPPNSLVVGVPAKVVKRGVTWDRRLLPV